MRSGKGGIMQVVGVTFLGEVMLDIPTAEWLQR
jgi:hypothetical protein